MQAGLVRMRRVYFYECGPREWAELDPLQLRARLFSYDTRVTKPVILSYTIPTELSFPVFIFFYQI